MSCQILPSNILEVFVRAWLAVPQRDQRSLLYGLKSLRDGAHLYDLDEQDRPVALFQLLADYNVKAYSDRYRETLDFAAGAEIPADLLREIYRQHVRVPVLGAQTAMTLGYAIGRYEYQISDAHDYLQSPIPAFLGRLLRAVVGEPAGRLVDDQVRLDLPQRAVVQASGAAPLLLTELREREIVVR